MENLESTDYYTCFLAYFTDVTEKPREVLTKKKKRTDRIAFTVT